MRFGAYEVQTVVMSRLRLDGGAMFGSVPKNLWSKKIPADEENCIPLAARCLYITGGGRKILVDVGMGEKWEEKQRKIFAIENTPPAQLPFEPDAITDIILTHLHFDHAGGISRWRDAEKREAELIYPKARVWLQKANLENGRAPSLRERASYLPENITVLDGAKLSLVEGSSEILPDIWVHRVDGHTVGLQWVEIRSGAESLVYPADLMPTSRHLPIPYIMGYDMCAATSLNEKEAFLKYATQRNAVIVFEHDPDVAAARAALDARGQWMVGEKVSV